MSHLITRRTALGVGSAAILATLAACGSSKSNGSSGSQATVGTDAEVELTFAGWSLDTTPEFQALADAFTAANPNITITVKEYSAQDYDTQLTTDLSAGSAPDVFPIKNLLRYYYYMSNGQLMDLSDMAAGFDGDEAIDLTYLEYDSKYFALPYRQDSWLLFYNKDAFAQAGVEEPDGSWTWEDYKQAASKITAAGEMKGAYHHTWQSVVQGFALAQYPDADLTSGDYSYLKPFYETALEMQDSGDVETFATAQAQSLTYQAQFGTQKAAMMPMGSWFIATLLEQQSTGDADEFEWGLAPIPQYESGHEDAPITFGDPTSLAVNAALEGDKASAAKAFVAFATGEEGARAMAAIGITPAYFSETIESTFFDLDGMPQDDLSKLAFSTHDTRPENPVSETVNDIQTILNDTHSEIMTETTPVDEALSKAGEDIKGQGLTA
ncbi:sugar ABC transporter substrate-binding protein [Actinomyces sp. Z5]|uniref:ABC transporter substrate-binding protein n=1 Tax=Actinomyces sp. Z5 TaxID=2250216 RepID=UPI000DCDD791|nr:extracellular solute-binding protein [Actinomyces sp. Z5]RAX20075.1 sugar ABC transporter substrate-binding protein [Actinomyces sp. Z5]